MGKMYALIDNDRVREIIKSEGIFENIPLEKRYPKEIVDKCVEIDENIKEGMDYNWETGEFTEHIEPESEPEYVEETFDSLSGEVVENLEVVEEEEADGEGVQE